MVERSAQTFSQALRRISAGEIAACYVLIGSERYLKQSLQEHLRQRILPPETAALNLTTYFAGDTELSAVLDCCRTPSFLGTRRLVIVRDADHYLPQMDILNAYLARPPAHTCLVLDFSEDKRRAGFAKLAPAAAVVQCSGFDARDGARWITDFLESRGARIAPSALALLAERAGENIAELAGLLEKLCLTAAPPAMITESALAALTRKTAADPGFAFLDALIRKQLPAALRLAQELASGKDPVEIIGLIFWQFKQLDSVKRLAAQRYSPEEIAEQTNFSPGQVRMALRKSAQLSAEDIYRALQLAGEADLAIKTGRKSPGLVIDWFVAQFCGA
ncbi:MAG: DNA polymerase III subunit delta [Candidatus Omnitrophica bacterium]|nr:DNA polymerase III subunit delta [Candidatus Omnitrophota bacterium]